MSSQQQNSQNSSSGSGSGSSGGQPVRKALIEKRIGRALSQYFKPIMVAPPHFGGEAPLDADSLTKPNFKLIKFRSKSDLLKEEARAAALAAAAQIENNVLEPPMALPSEPITTWLNLVDYLLAFCRRNQQVLRRRLGSPAYTKMVQSKGHKKLKVVGSILDTREKINDEE